MMPAAALIAELARSREWDWDFANLKRRAREERAALIRVTLQRARDEFLPERTDSLRQASRTLAHAIHGRGTDNVGLQTKLRQLVIQELGYLDDLPDWGRIRQLID